VPDEHRTPAGPDCHRHVTTPSPPPARAPVEDHLEELLDEALQETFPASDPPAPAVEAWIERRVEPPRAGG